MLILPIVYSVQLDTIQRGLYFVNCAAGVNKLYGSVQRGSPCGTLEGRVGSPVTDVIQGRSCLGMGV